MRSLGFKVIRFSSFYNKGIRDDKDIRGDAFCMGESSNRTTSSRITSSRTFEGVERGFKDNRDLRENKGNRDKTRKTIRG